MRAFSKTVTRAKSFRRALSFPEVLLWQALRRDILDVRFRRQHPIGPYILDFYCSAAKLCVEIDGAGHDHPDRALHDLDRNGWLAERGIRVLRFPAPDVFDAARRQDVIATIVAALAGAPSTASSGPPPPLRG